MKNLSFLPQWLRVFYVVASLNMVFFLVACLMGKTEIGSVWSVISFGLASIKWCFYLYYQNQAKSQPQ